MPSLLLPGILLSLCHVAPVQAFYFQLRPRKRLCFSENIETDGEMMIIDYAQRWTDETAEDDSFKTQIQVVSPKRRVIHSAKLTQVNGTTMVRAVQGLVGEYRVCFTAMNPAELVDFAVSIDTRNKVEVVDDADTDSTRQHVNEHGVEMQVMSYVDSDGEVKETLRTRWFFYRIKREVNVIRGLLRQASFSVTYFKQRLTTLRSTGKRTLRRVYLFGMLKAVAIIAVILWQYRRFQNVLYKKKIV
ncbi:COP-coated vesicle membrane protein erv25 precursor [Perkinsela sp. CCAP 1560/4]|nr:COP-coated vesicle membrane protein erv25 precursor [Perkinsela sp. CCAP 1560/4]|eukprot:KNH05445.1 COP-coated vesicle membrane protein erv25 precursor [Perkinsela sp. CCAP 1560/4]